MFKNQNRINKYGSCFFNNNIKENRGIKDVGIINFKGKSISVQVWRILELQD